MKKIFLNSIFLGSCLFFSLHSYAQSCDLNESYDSTINCSSNTVSVRSENELNDYLLNYGLNDNEYSNLLINFNYNGDELSIHSPCKIEISKNVRVQSSMFCVKSLNKVSSGKNVDFQTDKLSITSVYNSITFGENSKFNNGEGYFTSGSSISFGKNIEIRAIDLNIESESKSIVFGENNKINSTNVNITSPSNIVFGKNTELNTVLISIHSLNESLTFLENNKLTSKDISLSSADKILFEKNCSIASSGDTSIVSTGTATLSGVSVGQNTSIKSENLSIESLREISFSRNSRIEVDSFVGLESKGRLLNTNISFEKGNSVKAKELNIDAGRNVFFGENSSLSIVDSLSIGAHSSSISEVFLSSGVRLESRSISVDSDHAVSLDSNSSITGKDSITLNGSVCSFNSRSRYTAPVIEGTCFGDVVSNLAPFAIAGVNQLGSLSKKVILDGSKSYDPENSTLTYFFEIVEKPQNSIATLLKSDTPFPEFYIDAAGDYKIKLTVSDGENSSEDFVHVSTEDSIPNIIVEDFYHVSIGDPLEIDATLSFDSDSEHLTFDWSIISLPNQSSSSISPSSHGKAILTPDLEGEYSVKLTLSDGENVVEKFITISTTSTKPRIVLDSNLTSYRSSPLLLDFSQSVVNHPSTLKFTYTLLYKSVGSAFTITKLSNGKIEVSADSIGQYVIAVMAEAGDGSYSHKTYTININNQLPKIILSDFELINQTLSNITISASNSIDLDEDSLTFLWTKVSTPPNSNAPSEITGDTLFFSLDQSGEYVYSLAVSDGLDVKHLVVTFTSSHKPIAHFNIPSSLYVGDTLLLNGTGSIDQDDDELFFEWRLVSAPSGTDANIGNLLAGNTSILFDKEGDYTIALSVQDEYFRSEVVTRTISISQFINFPPVINHVDSQSVTLGEDISFTISASDENGTKINYYLGSKYTIPSGVKLDSDSGLFQWHPSEEDVGQHRFEVIANDGKETTKLDFEISVIGVDSTAPTSFIGTVVDSNAQTSDNDPLPIVGATISIIGTDLVTTTDQNGKFIFANIPDTEEVVFKIDSSTATDTPDSGRYANFIELIHLIKGAVNVISRPFYLPRIAMSSITQVVPDKVTNVINAELGIEINVPANSAALPDGTPFYGELSISIVPQNLAPVSLPPGVNPGMLITVQPSGVQFLEEVPITYPNIEGYPAGSELSIYQMNDKLGRFEVVGRGIVSDNEKNIVTVSGGLRNTSWGYTIPDPITLWEKITILLNSFTGKTEPSCLRACAKGSHIDIATGRMYQDHFISTYKSLGVDRGLKLIYGSKEASGYSVASIHTLKNNVKPNFVEISTSINGVKQPFKTTADISLDDNYDDSELYRQYSNMFTGDLESGLYPYEAEIKSIYTQSTTSRFLSDVVDNPEFPVVNYKSSPVGYGWAIDNVKSLKFGSQGAVMYLDGAFDYGIFSPLVQGTYTTPYGLSSELVKEDDKYELREKDGVKHVFNLDGQHQFSIDKNGRQTSYFYDHLNRLISIQDPTGQSISLVYENNLLSEIRDPSGRVTKLAHDESGHLVKIIDPDLSELNYTYNDHLLIIKKDKSDEVTSYIYNSFGFLKGINRPDGENSEYSPIEDTIDQTIESINSDKSVISRSKMDLKDISNIVIKPIAKEAIRCTKSSRKKYIGSSRYVIIEIRKCRRFTEYLEVERDFASDNSFGESEYDSLGNPIIQIDKTGRVKRYNYDNKGNLLRQSDYVGFNVFSETTYDDEYSMPISYKDKLGHMTIFNLDDSGNIEKIIDPNNSVTAIKYTNKGQVRLIRDDSGNKTEIYYDHESGNISRVKDSQGNITNLYYDSRGNVVQVINPNGKSSFFEYDEMNRVVKTINQLDNEVTFTYDKSGNLLTLTDSNSGTTSFTYDKQGNVLKRVDPLGRVEEFIYDLRGNILLYTDKNQVQTRFTYDDDYRLIEKLVGIIKYEYSYDAEGRLLGASTDESGVSFEYDLVGRMKKVSSLESNITPAVDLNYVYDDNDSLTEINSSYADIVYQRDSLSRVTKIKYGNLDFLYSYDSLGRRESIQRPNGTSSNLSYDRTSKLLGLIHSNSTEDLIKFAYSHDANGNRTQMKTDRVSIATESPVLTYEYDDSDQLISATHPTLGRSDETFVFDALGNRLRKTGVSVDSTFNLNNQLVEDSSYTYGYDINGNLISKINKADQSVTKYSWNSLNQLVKIEKQISLSTPAISIVEYNYDIFGRRSSKNINGEITSYIYDNEDIFLEFDGDKNLKATYIHGPGIDEPLMMSREGSNYFYHTDGLGSVVGLSNDLGEIEQQYLYTSFGGMTVFNKEGSEIQSVDGIKNPYGYTGREMDTESDLYFYRARYYNPSTGRFMSSDPIGFAAGDTNLYRYVGNNPVNRIDPSGLIDPVTASILIGGGIGAIAGGTSAFLAGGDIGQIATAAAIGGVAGGASVAGGIGGAIGAVLTGFGVGVAADVANQTLVSGRSISNLNFGSVALSGTIGALSGGIGAVAGTRAFFNSRTIGNPPNLSSAIRAEQVTGALVGGGVAGFGTVGAGLVCQ